MSRYSPTRGPERWDRDRFESASRGPPLVERDIRYEEKDYYSRPRYEEAPQERRPSRQTRYEEVDRYEERERFADPVPFRPRPSASRYYEEERDVYAGAMVPTRAREPERERDLEIDIRRTEIDRYNPPAPRGPPGRPTFIRRQSSLETFDRKSRPRYGDAVKEETVYIPSAPRRRSPPRFVERDFEEIRIAEPEFYGDEEFRGYREREISRYRKNRQSGGESEFVEEREEIVEKEFPRRGKTRMPMRLVNKRAVIELGYPFEEEGETLIILKALGKEHIDEVIRISKEMNSRAPAQEEIRKTYVYERKTASPPREEEKVIERRTEIIREGPSSPAEIPRSVREWDVMSGTASKSKRSPSPSSASTTTVHSSHHPKSSKSRRSRAHSTSATERREIILEEDFEESNTIRGGIGALIIPDHKSRSERSIRAEIKALEAEKKALRLERDAQRLRGEYGEVIITRERDEDVVEVRKDKKAPDPRIIRAMLATLT